MKTILKPLRILKFGSLKIVEAELLYGHPYIINKELVFYKNRTSSCRIIIRGSSPQSTTINTFDYRYEGNDIEDQEIKNESIITDFDYEEAVQILLNQSR